MLGLSQNPFADKSVYVSVSCDATFYSRRKPLFLFLGTKDLEVYGILHKNVCKTDATIRDNFLK